MKKRKEPEAQRLDELKRMLRRSRQDRVSSYYECPRCEKNPCCEGLCVDCIESEIEELEGTGA